MDIKINRLLCLLLAVLLLVSAFVFPSNAGSYDGTITLSSVTANRDGEVTVSVTLSGCRTLKSMMLKNLIYDSTNLTFVSGSWKVDNLAVSSNGLAAGKSASMALYSNTDINGTVYELKFKVNSTAAFGEYPIGITVYANYMAEDSNDLPVNLNVTSGKITVECVHSYSSDWSTDADSHWHECSICGDKKDYAAHTFEWVTDTAATEDTTGLKHEECTVCAYKRNENTVIEKLAHTHNMTHTAASEATCKAEGNIEYWYCTKCGKYYKDEAGNIETTLADTVIEKAAHTLAHTAAQEATCIAKGNIEYWYCSVCDKYFSDSTATTEITQADTEIAMKEHTPSSDWSADETYHWHGCTGCTAQFDKAEHTYEWVTDREATPTVAGVKHEECTVCHHKRSEGTSIAKVGDVNADGVVNSDDAIYLLNYTLKPESYPITGDCNFDGEGVVTSDDAIYLLNYTLSKSEYPLQ